MKKIGLIVSLCLLLGGCASTPAPLFSPSQGTLTESEKVDFPELNVITALGLGDTLAAKGYKSYTPAIKVLNEVTLENRTGARPRHWVPEGSKGKLSSVVTVLKTGEKIQANKKQIDHYKSYYEESNEWVRKKYFPQRKELFDCKQISQKSNAQVISQDQIEEIGRLIAMIWMRKNARINQLEAKTSAYKQIIKKSLRGKVKFETPRYHNKIENFFDC